MSFEYKGYRSAKKRFGLIFYVFLLIKCVSSSCDVQQNTCPVGYYSLKTCMHMSGILITLACGSWYKAKDENDDLPKSVLIATLLHAVGITLPHIRTLLQKKKQEPKVCTTDDRSWWFGIAAYLGSFFAHCYGDNRCFQAGEKVYSLFKGNDVYAIKTAKNLVPGLLAHMLGFALSECAQSSLNQG